MENLLLAYRVVVQTYDLHWQSSEGLVFYVPAFSARDALTCLTTYINNSDMVAHNKINRVIGIECVESIPNERPSGHYLLKGGRCD